MSSAEQLTAENEGLKRQAVILVTQRDGMAFWVRQCRRDLASALAQNLCNPVQIELRLAVLDRALALLDCPDHDERSHECKLPATDKETPCTSARTSPPRPR
jgi:hypothetical protein